MRSMFGHPTRKPRLQIALFALLVATANGGGVEQQAEEDQAGAKALIAAIDAHQAGIRDLRARFTQTVYSPSIQRSETQTGRVWVRRPGLMRWEYDEPNPSTFTSDGEAVRLYYPQDAQLQIHPASGLFSQKALGLLMGEAAIGDAYDPHVLPDGEAGEKRVKLTPRDGSFTSLELAVAPDTHALRSSVFIDPFGQETRIQLHDLNENSGVRVERFELLVPDGTEVFDLRAGASP